MPEDKDIIEELEDLRLILEKAQTERWVWFASNSENGKDCKYARVAAQIFFQEYDQKIKDKIKYLYDKYYK